MKARTALFIALIATSGSVGAYCPSPSNPEESNAYEACLDAEARADARQNDWYEEQERADAQREAERAREEYEDERERSYVWGRDEEGG